MAGVSKSAAGAEQAAGAPRRAPARTWAGRGSGGTCDLCRLVIDEDQIEYEVELDSHNEILTLHLDCYERWALSHESIRPLKEEDR